MHVNVDADRRCATGDAEGEIRAFWAYAAERRHYIEVTRQLAIEFLDDALCHVSNVLRLGLGEGCRSNELGDFPHAEPAYFIRRRRNLEQPYRRWQRYFVECPYRDYAGSKLVERCCVSLIGEIEHRGIGKLLNFMPDPTGHFVDVERTFCHGGQ